MQDVYVVAVGMIPFGKYPDKGIKDLTAMVMQNLFNHSPVTQDQIEAANAWELDRTLEIAMDALRCPPPDADVTKISGGERRRVALCRLLLQRPDLLLLDEPTNHLDAESVAWLERFLGDYPGTVVAVTHDRYFLDNVAGWILEMDRGAGIPWEGNYSSWLDQKQARLAQEEKTATARQRTLARELEWVRMAPRARQAKSKARVAAYERLLQEEADRLPETVEIDMRGMEIHEANPFEARRIGELFVLTERPPHGDASILYPEPEQSRAGPPRIPGDGGIHP